MATLLAKGGYGCVFRPRITCAGKVGRDASRVTKVQAVSAASDNELSVGAVVRGIPNYALHFGPALSACQITASAIGEDVVKVCPPIHGSKELLLITFAYVPNVEFSTVLAAAVQSSEDLYLAINSYSLLLRSLALLADAGVVQFDLKPENVLYDWDNHRPLIIDFGVSIDLGTLRPSAWPDRFYVYAPDYYIWPVEVHYICYLVNKNAAPSRKELDEVVASAVDQNKGLAGFSPAFRDRYAEAARDNLAQYLGKPRMGVIGALLEHATTWDTYSLAVMYLRALGMWSKARYTNNLFVTAMTQALLESMAPVPERRPSPGEAVSAFNSIFNSDQPLACDIADMERFRASVMSSSPR
jgi:serine/threonine protein kinase